MPTLTEIGLSGADVTQWLSLVAPAKTPQSVVARLNAEIVKILATPAVRDKLDAAGLEPAPSSPQELAAMFRDGMARWGPLVKELNLKAD